MHYAFTTLDAVLMENLEKRRYKRQDGIMANSKCNNWMFIWVCTVKKVEITEQNAVIAMRVLKDSLVNNFYFCV